MPPEPENEFARLVKKSKMIAKDVMAYERIQMKLGARRRDRSDLMSWERRNSDSTSLSIGYKPRVNGPVGIAPEPGNILNSKGNQRYYSYDGEWKNGKMHGRGTYYFADGSKYTGGFLIGERHGHGRME